MQKQLKNGLILTILSFFLVSCNFNEISGNLWGKFQKTPENTELIPIEEKEEVINEGNKECAHQYVDEKVAPTCENEGFTEHTCSLCGSSFRDTYFEPLGHKYHHVDSKEPTFDESGCIEHYYCERCSKYFDGQKQEIDIIDVATQLEIFDYKDSTEPVLLIHGDLDFSYDKNKFNEIINEINNCISRLDSNDGSLTYIKVNETYNELLSFYNELYDKMLKANTVADIYNRASDYQNSSEITENLMTCYTKLYSLLAAVARSSLSIKVSFFGQQSSYAELADYYESIANNESSALELEMDNIKNKYKSGEVDEETTLQNYIKTANDYAKTFGYANFQSFSYRNVYGREYTISDASSLKSNITNYIVPLYNKFNQKLTYYYNRAYSTNDSQSYQYRAAINTTGFLESFFFGYYLDYLTNYAEFLGGNYLKNYKNYFEKGNYFYSNIKNDNITGYVNSYGNGTQYMFLGKNYQNSTTFIHEFGHYNAGIEFGSLSSYDLAETQSQGNEMLYYYYLAQNGDLSELTANYFLYSQIQSMLFTILVGYQINELETWAYSTETFTKTELLNKWHEIGNACGIQLSNYDQYLYLILINYNCYYISYATAALAAMEIFATATNDINLGKSAYQSIYKKDIANEGFTKSLKNAGLYSVFSNDAFTLINSISNL